MSQKRQVSLPELQAGQRGRIVEISGGRGLVAHLAALGVRPGKVITKVSSMFLRGPVTAQVDNTQVAIGFGMARRIVVELEEEQSD